MLSRLLNIIMLLVGFGGLLIFAIDSDIILRDATVSNVFTIVVSLLVIINLVKFIRRKQLKNKNGTPDHYKMNNRNTR